jgi:carboxymethylenebutenolidase
MSHVNQTTWTGIAADVRAAAEHLRMADEGRVEALFTVGFCFGGRLAFLTSTLGLGLAGAIGFYGIPVGPGRAETAAPADVAAELANPILALFGAADSAIPPESIATFDEALTKAGVEHRFVAYDGAPHSFFDRKAEEFAEASKGAWEETLTFVRGRTPSPVAGA